MWTSLLETMLKLFAAMLIGFGCNKKGMMDAKTNKHLSGLIVTVTGPALILASVQRVDVGMKGQVVKLIVFGLLMYLGLVLLSAVFCKVLRIGKGRTGVWRVLLIFANSSFMGLPMAQALFGDEAVFYTSMLHLGFNLYMYTLGIRLLMEGSGETEKGSWKKMVNAGTISGILALVLFFTGWQMPKAIHGTVAFIGDLTPALSMIVLGSMLAEYPVRLLFADRDLYKLAAVKLIVIPVLLWLAGTFIFADAQLQGVILVSTAMPSAALCVMMANRYESGEETAAAGVFLTTVLSMLTVPLLCGILLSF